MNERTAGCMFNLGLLIFLVGMALYGFQVGGAVWIVALGVGAMLVGFIFGKGR